MEETVSLKDYYNKLVQVQTSLKIARALHTEVYHHLNNGAAVLQSLIRTRSQPQDAGQESRFLATAHTIADDTAEKLHTMMDPIYQDAGLLALHTTHLPDLIANPAQMTRANFNALAAFNDHLHTVDETLRGMRVEAEVKLLAASGLVSPDFKLCAMDDAFRDYYKKLVQVQLSVKVARALEQEMDATFGPLAETRQLMNPVGENTMRENLTSLRLVDLLLAGKQVTPANYDALAAFNDRLNTVNDRFRHLRAQYEIKNLRRQGVVSADFTL